jgi:cytochrome c-type biogenesis protein CcmH
MLRRIVPLALVLWTVAFSAGAREAVPVGQDPVIERRMMALSQELRCLVCQNQTLADSQADLAADLRQEIRELMQKGQSDEQVKQYLVARYGDFVLYRPPLKPLTWLLWFGPALLLAVGLTALYAVLIRRRKLAAAQPLTTDQEQQALALLSEDERQLS